MSEEYFDILDERGNLTGEKRPRFEAHSQGLWHRTVHIYFFRKIDTEIEFLVHLRSKTKDLSPNKWDTRFGGHLKAGENMRDTIRSELKEEVGLELDETHLIKGEILKRDHFPNREFTSVYYYNFDGESDSLKFDDGEVQEVKWMNYEDIINSIEKNPSDWSGRIEGFKSVSNFLRKELKV